MDAGVAVYDLPTGWVCAATRDGRIFFMEYVIHTYFYQALTYTYYFWWL